MSEYIYQDEIMTMYFYGKVPPQTPVIAGSGGGVVQCEYCKSKYRMGSSYFLHNLNLICTECERITKFRPEYPARIIGYDETD